MPFFSLAWYSPSPKSSARNGLDLHLWNEGRKWLAEEGMIEGLGVRVGMAAYNPGSEERAWNRLDQSSSLRWRKWDERNGTLRWEGNHERERKEGKWWAWRSNS